MPATKKPAVDAASKVFSAEEKAAMKELIRERKVSLDPPTGLRWEGG